VEQAPDKSKSPPPTSYRETFRRHRKLFLLPVILGAVAAGAIGFTSGAKYTSTASVWVDTAPPLASSVGAGLTTPLTEPPAAAEQGILTELLTTQEFASSVAKSSLLGKYLGSEASIQKNAPTYVEDGQVGTLVTGQQILKITYSAQSAAMAQSVLGGIVDQLRSYNNGLSASHDQAAVAYDRAQVNIAKAALATAQNNVNTYMAQHPNASQSDPNLLSLTSAETNAGTQLGQANATLSQATGTRDEGGWTIRVVDPPDPAISAALGKKKLLELILGGAFGGLVLSFLVVVALTPAKKEVWEDELPMGKPYAPSAGSFPVQSPPMPTGLGRDRPRLVAGERRFSFRSPSEHNDR
jgi:uncharacterized protein involved in exopolysaccharide biosynthesis